MSNTSRMILSSLLGVAFFALAAQPALAQQPRNNSPKQAQKQQTSYNKQAGHDQKAQVQIASNRSKSGQHQQINKNHNQRPDKKQQISRDKRPGQNHKITKNHDRRPDQKRQISHDRRQNNGPKHWSHGMTSTKARNLAKAHHMAGYKPLPPATKKHLVVGRPVPTHVVVHHVPVDMHNRLPKHSSYEWRISGRDLLLVATGTLILHEIIENVFY